MTKVAGGVNFPIPSDNIEIIRHVAKLPSFSEIPGQKAEKDGDGQREPEQGRAKQEVIVAIGICNQPSWGDDRVNCLEESQQVTLLGSRQN